MGSPASESAVVVLGLLAAAAVGQVVPTASTSGGVATITTTTAIVLASHDSPPGVPADPSSTTPTAEELSGLLYSLADPGVSAFAKGGLVEGGIGPSQAVVIDREFGNANQDGYLPLTFAVGTVQSNGPGLASAPVTITGPKTSAYNTQIDFVNQDGWKLSRESALQLMNAASGSH